MPLFIHVNISGVDIRSKFCEKRNRNFIINPQLYMDLVPRDKVVRCWQYKNNFLLHLRTFKTPNFRNRLTTIQVYLDQLHRNNKDNF